MNIKDEDWVDLLAGREVEGVSEEDKALMAAVREQLINDSSDEIEVTEEELEVERRQFF